MLPDLLRHVRYEVIPAKSIEAKVVESVPRDVTLTVTASPAKGLDATLELTERLAARGYRVVPHLSARLVVDEVHLEEIVKRMQAIGVDDVFVPAGDADPPAGKYDAALPVLTELTRRGKPFADIGITGYPESHPAIDDDVTIQAMWDKRSHATYIVSNLCFDPEAISGWIGRVRRRNVMLPIHVGVAGPVERAKLLSMATKIGVGESAKFLTKHVSWFVRFAAPGGYSPDRLLRKTAGALTAPHSGVAGLHVFTFNQVAETEQWRQQLLQRLTRRG
jgi:methylenetetrahydrofolate reductase (NADPH)